MGGLAHLAALLLLAAGLSACGGTLHETRLDTAPGAPAASGPASGLDSPANMFTRLGGDKAGSAMVVYHQGDDFGNIHQQVLAQGSDGHFTPAWTGKLSKFSTVAFALYNFNVLGYSGPQTLTLNWAAPPAAGNLWVAFSQWDKDRWMWYPGRTDSVMEIGGTGLMQYAKSGTGELLVVVLLLGSNAWDLHEVYIGHAVHISGYDIQAVGATGGAGAGGDVFGAGDNANIVANQALALQLNSVNGTFDGLNFDASTFPTGMDQAMYDMILAAAADNVNWSFANVGESAARFVGPWFAPDSADYTGTGDPGAGTVCPDDDPESTAPDSEGNANTDLGAGVLPSSDPQVTIIVPASVDYTVGFDIAADPVAPVIEGYYSDPTLSTTLTQLEAGGAGQTVVFLNMTSWGATGTSIPTENTITKFELHTQNALDMRDMSQTYTLTLDADDPPDNDPEIGEYWIYHNDILAIDVFICKVPAIQVTPGSSLAFRFFDGTTWSSINKPTDLLTSTPPLPPEDLVTLPASYDRSVLPLPYLQVFRNEPKVRRDGRFNMNAISGTATPVDQAAYDDALKTGPTSYDFPISFREAIIGGHIAYLPYPIIVLKIDRDDPDNWPTINGPTDPDAEPDILIPANDGREAGRICVDVTPIIVNLSPPVLNNEYWCTYDLYDATSRNIGEGHFKIYDTPIEPVLPVGVEWGVNVGDRGDWNKVDFNTLCTNKAVNGTTMTTPTPDVLWVRFNGNTRVLDWNEYWQDDETNQDNIQLIVQDSELEQSALQMCLVIAGVTLNNDYIAIHHLNLNNGAGWYYDWAAAFPSSGILTPGQTYDLGLDDPTVAGVDFWFPDQLSIIGANPSFP